MGDKPALKIVDIVHEEFQNVRTFVRAYDRLHAVELMNRDVDFQMRETVESALAFGRATLVRHGTRHAWVAQLASKKPHGEVGGSHQLRQ